VVYLDLMAGVDMAHSALATAGVIIEAEPLPDGLVRRGCRLAERAGADFVVTGTGGSTSRRTIGRVSVLRDSVGPRVGVKAAGRLRSADDVRAAAAAGASRIVTRLTPAILREAGRSRDAPRLEPAGIAG
jgi:deoxyribose-phosphate aldolase